MKRLPAENSNLKEPGRLPNVSAPPLKKIRTMDYDVTMAPEKIDVEQSGRMCENREDGSWHFLKLPLTLLKPCWNRGENHEENCNGQ